MVKHIVCFKMKDRNNCQKAKEILLSMKGKVPEIKDINVNLDTLHSERSFDIILEVVVDSLITLETYQKNKYHCEVVKKFMHSVIEKSIALDFEI